MDISALVDLLEEKECKALEQFMNAKVGSYEEALETGK